MAHYSKAASPLELQVAADIFLAVIECYSSDDLLVPKYIIWPLRLSPNTDSPSRIRLCIKSSHCIALLDNHSQPLVQNMYENHDIAEAWLNEREESRDKNIEGRILPEE